MAYKEARHDDIAMILDYAERLPWFIASSEDETETFRSYLVALAERYPMCNQALRKFDEPTAPERW